LRRLTVLDHHHREALIALDGTRCVGVARFARRPEDPHVADVAVTVADDWQRRGLGGALLVRLTRRARAEGLTTFSALIGNENLAARALLRMPGATVTVVDRDVAATEYAVVLPGEGPEPTSDAGPHDRVAA
jgi:GNAT superfamily N-acetyltransferase